MTEVKLSEKYGWGQERASLLHTAEYGIELLLYGIACEMEQLTENHLC